MIENNVYPYPVDFVGIGAPKSGTTWLARQLSNHPEIDMSGERDFFSIEARLYGKYDDIDGLYDKQNNKLRGNYHNNYLYSPYTLGYLSGNLPDVKVYVILRNPIDRAISEYLHHVVWIQDIEINESFEDSLKKPYVRSAILDRGFYDVYLKRWFEKFGSSQILVLLYEDIKNNGLKILENIYRFLNVDHTYKPAMSRKKINYNAINNIRVNEKTLDLLAEIYAPTKEYVEKLLNRDLSSLWNKNVKRVSDKHDVSETNVLFARAMMHYDNNNFQDAVNVLMELFNRREKNKFVYQTLSEIFRRFNRFDLAKQVESVGKQVVDYKS